MIGGNRGIGSIEKFTQLALKKKIYIATLTLAYPIIYSSPSSHDQDAQLCNLALWLTSQQSKIIVELSLMDCQICTPPPPIPFHFSADDSKKKDKANIAS